MSALDRYRESDPRSENALREQGVETTEHFTGDYTRLNRETVKTDLLSWLTRRVWVLNYSLEEARQRYADRRQLLREACVCVALAMLRLAGVRFG